MKRSPNETVFRWRRRVASTDRNTAHHAASATALPRMAYGAARHRPRRSCPHHFWHEWNPIEFSVGIKCCGNLCAAAYLDELATEKALAFNHEYSPVCRTDLGASRPMKSSARQVPRRQVNRAAQHCMELYRMLSRLCSVNLCEVNQRT